MAVGPKLPFTMEEIFQIEIHLQDQENWHDLALLSLGLDSMLRAGDLLKLQVWHVQYPNGQMRSKVTTKQKKTKRSVFPKLTEVTQNYLRYWIEVSGKSPNKFLFTRYKNGENPLPITRNYYADLVKGWAENLSHHPGDYSTHSIRRTKPVHMYWLGEDIALISKILGHKSIAVTIEYLGITQQKADAASLRHPMLKGMKSGKQRNAKSKKPSSSVS